MSERPPLNQSTVLVTGAAGFIGSHLVDRLLTEGVKKIIAVDNLAYGQWANLQPAMTAARECIETVTLDLADTQGEGWLVCLKGVDYVFHLAAEKHNQSKHSPQRVIDVNITGTLRLFQAAQQAGVNKIVFTSSLYAYGIHASSPMREDQLPMPDTVYGISKLAGEHCLHYLAAQYGLSSTVLRLFFVYGPRQFAQTGYKSVIVSNFERMLAGQAPWIFGDGEQALDYVYVTDVADALVRAMMTPAADGQTLNIGSGHPLSVNELTQAMQVISGVDAAPVYQPPDWTAGTRRFADPQRARDLLNWQAITPIGQGLADVYAWLQASRQRPDSALPG